MNTPTHPLDHVALAARTLILVTARSAVALLLALLVWSMLPMLLGWQSSLVMSGSMEPRIRPGDVVLSQPVRAVELVPGQVVMVANPARPGTLLLHRMVRRNPDGNLVTRGDANPTNDSTPVPPSLVRGLPRLRVPFVGLPLLWLRRGEYGRVLLFGLGLLGVFALAGGGSAGRPARQTG